MSKVKRIINYYLLHQYPDDVRGEFVDAMCRGFVGATPPYKMSTKKAVTDCHHFIVSSFNWQDVQPR